MDFQSNAARLFSGEELKKLFTTEPSPWSVQFRTGNTDGQQPSTVSDRNFASTCRDPRTESSHDTRLNSYSSTVS